MQVTLPMLSASAPVQSVPGLTEEPTDFATTLDNITALLPLSGTGPAVPEGEENTEDHPAKTDPAEATSSGNDMAMALHIAEMLPALSGAVQSDLSGGKDVGIPVNTRSGRGRGDPQILPETPSRPATASPAPTSSDDLLAMSPISTAPVADHPLAVSPITATPHQGTRPAEGLPKVEYAMAPSTQPPVDGAQAMGGHLSPISTGSDPATPRHETAMLASADHAVTLHSVGIASTGAPEPVLPASSPLPPPPGVLAGEPGSTAWAQSLGQHISCFTRDEIHHAELQLHPADLGRLQISLRLNNEQVQLHFMTADHQVRAALESALPHLRTSLADSGIQLGQSSVGSSDTPASWHAPEQDKGASAGYPGQETDDRAVSDEVSSTPRVTQTWGVNTFV